jgi:hypothetical protein
MRAERQFSRLIRLTGDRLGGLMVRVPGYRLRDPEFDSGANRSSGKQWAWKRSLNLMRTGELFARKTAAPA